MTSAGLTKPKKPSAGSQRASAPVIRKPHKYQRRGVEWLVSHGGAGIFAAPGAGKTAVTLKAFLAMKKAKLARRALVVATLRVSYKVWPVEAEAWKDSEWDEIRGLRITLLHGSKKELRLQNDDADIYVVNFDGLKWLLEEHYEDFRKLGIDTLVIDESTKVKHTNTKRFKILKPWLPTFKRRWILTGKPIPRSYLDLFGQIYVIDLGHSLGRFITHYRTMFFTSLDRFGWNWVLQKGAEEKIQAQIAPYIFQLEPGDYKEIPIVENVIRVDLPDAARKVYDELEEQLLTELEDGNVVTAISSGAASQKCSQVANGGLYHQANFADPTEKYLALSGRRTWTDLHEVKTDAVLDLVEELQGSPAMVVYEYHHDLARLKKIFPDAPYTGGKVPGINGWAPLNEKDPTVELWNDDRIPVLLVNAQSMAHGLNLQYGTARNILWHSVTYDRELYDQLNMRIARQGQTASSIFSHFIVATNTTDEAKIKALKKKGKVQDNFLSALREYAKEKGR